MDMIIAFFQQLWELAQAGFTGVNQVLGLIIALVGALLMHGWRDLWRSAAGAAVIHVIIGAILPMLDGGAFTLPNVVSITFWMTLLALFLGFSIVIALFFLVKSLFMGRGRAASH